MRLPRRVPVPLPRFGGACWLLRAQHFEDGVESRKIDMAFLGLAVVLQIRTTGVKRLSFQGCPVKKDQLLIDCVEVFAQPELFTSATDYLGADIGQCPPPNEIRASHFLGFEQLFVDELSRQVLERIFRIHAQQFLKHR